MNDLEKSLEARLRSAQERLIIAESASGVGSFELELKSGTWHWSPQIPLLFGIDAAHASLTFADVERAIFVDDVPKVQSAIQEAAETKQYYAEFRVRHPDGSIHWLAGKGKVTAEADGQWLRGAYYEITERKTLEARLLSVNETLEARLAELRDEAHILEVLNRTGASVAAELDLERLVQSVTDAGVELSGAQFGAFFYNVYKEDGEAYTLYTLSGVPREAFSKFPMPRNTQIFDPTFKGKGIVRSYDILADPRYGQNPPYHGMPEGHLPVRSYLAIPVKSRNGEVLGGLFFGHPQPGVFTDRAERIMTGLAAQAAVAIDNARLYQSSQREVAARTEAEQTLQELNATLEERAIERANQLVESSKRLEDTERRFRLLVEAVTDYAIYMLDPNGHVINWNPGAERIKGYSRAEIIGQHFSRFYSQQDRDNRIPETALATAARTGKYQSEAWRVRKDGSTFWASVVINSIYGAEGELLGFAKITRDMTEQRAADERMRQAQKMEGIGQLTGGIAHDFNNLLTVILGNLSALHRHLGDPQLDLPRLERSASNAMRGARRAESLTHRLLAFSRQQPLEPKSVDVGRLVAGMSDLLRRSLGEQIAVETVLAGGLWRAYADPNQTEVAILNLAVNARDAMQEGGKLTIETANVYLDDKYAASQAEVLPGQYIMIAVTDSGAGMTPEVKAKAFDPFFTTKGIGHGTGLGLSQVYGFVKQSRGHVKIYSEVGEGTTVKLYLPRMHAAEEVEAEVSSVAVPGGAMSETILVVEDDEDVRAYSTDSLRELGYYVIEAPNGTAALQMLDSHPEIQVMFTDVGLPGNLNGRQLAEEALKRRSNLKILFTTGYARNAIVHDGRLDPGVELLTKPFTQADLGTKLRDIIDARTVPGRVLIVEDEALIQAFAVDYLEEVGLRVDVASTAMGALDKLRLIPGGVDAAVIDVQLPDRRGDSLIPELHSMYPSLPIILATGNIDGELRKRFEHNSRVSFLSKPYSPEELGAALRAVGLKF